MAGDPYFDNVVLLMHMDGSNGSTTFTDVKGKTITPYGNAQISTAQSQFGGASAVFDGAGDYLTAGNSSDFNLSGDFTIEMFVYVTAFSNNYASLLGSSTGSFAANATYIMVYGPGDPRYKKFALGLQGTRFVNNTQLNTGVFYHIAITRSGTSIRLFLDGAQDGTGTSSAAFRFDDSGMRIGSNGWDGGGSFFNGYIDDLRITKGVARYTSAFTVPTEAYPDTGIYRNRQSPLSINQSLYSNNRIRYQGI